MIDGESEFMVELRKRRHQMETARTAWHEHRPPEVSDAALREAERLERVYLDAMGDFARWAAIAIDCGKLVEVS